MWLPLPGADGTVVISVSDNGIGIPEHRKKHLFEPFETTKPKGQGLGLFGARHIVELHNGRIQVESKEGEGTEVIVSLPAAPTAEDEAVMVEKDGTEPSKARVAV